MRHVSGVGRLRVLRYFCSTETEWRSRSGVTHCIPPSSMGALLMQSSLGVLAGGACHAGGALLPGPLPPHAGCRGSSSSRKHGGARFTKCSREHAAAFGYGSAQRCRSGRRHGNSTGMSTRQHSLVMSAVLCGIDGPADAPLLSAMAAHNVAAAAAAMAAAQVCSHGNMCTIYICIFASKICPR